VNCKHGAAAAIAAKAKRQTAAPSWRRVMEELTEGARRPKAGLTPLGLLVDDHYGALSLLPVQRGARGKWVKAGAS
jgi:hypothetical protein